MQEACDAELARLLDEGEVRSAFSEENGNGQKIKQKQKDDVMDMIIVDRSNSPEDLKHQEQEKNGLQSIKDNKSSILK